MYIVKDLDITGGDKMKVKISLIVPPTEKKSSKSHCAERNTAVHFSCSQRNVNVYLTYSHTHMSMWPYLMHEKHLMFVLRNYLHVCTIRIFMEVGQEIP